MHTSNIEYLKIVTNGCHVNIAYACTLCVYDLPVYRNHTKEYLRTRKHREVGGSPWLKFILIVLLIEQLYLLHYIHCMYAPCYTARKPVSH